MTELDHNSSDRSNSGTSRKSILWMLVISAILPLLVNAYGSFAGCVLAVLVSLALWVNPRLRQEKALVVLIGIVLVENIVFTAALFGVFQDLR